VVSSTPRLHFIPEKDPVPIVQEAGWAPGLVWMGGKSRPQRDLIPELSSQALYIYIYSIKFAKTVIQYSITLIQAHNKQM